MSTYTSTLNQIVFATKYRSPCLNENDMERVSKYIWKTCEHLNCHPYAVNGYRDHMHIVVAIHPSVPVADLVKTIKTRSSRMIKENGLFKGFRNWQEGYAWFTYHAKLTKTLIRYVENQVQHHRKQTSEEELISMLKRHGITYDPKHAR